MEHLESINPSNSRRQNLSKMEGLWPHFGGLGASFWSHLRVWADSGSQARLGRRFGQILGDCRSQDCSNLGPKTVPCWSQHRIKVDCEIRLFFDAFENRCLVEFWWILRRKWRQIGTKIGSKIDIGGTTEKSTKR